MKMLRTVFKVFKEDLWKLSNVGNILYLFNNHIQTVRQQDSAEDLMRRAERVFYLVLHAAILEVEQFGLVESVHRCMLYTV